MNIEVKRLKGEPLRLDVEVLRLKGEPLRLKIEVLRVKVEPLRLKVEVLRVKVEPLRLKVEVLRVKSEPLRLKCQEILWSFLTQRRRGAESKERVFGFLTKAWQKVLRADMIDVITEPKCL
ncbi:hypothetical protein [Nostoc cycadae]|uniref:hypothetical protein n=1 Tax=Nostoc cycadae TaxID=246795 RepID=UPI000CCC8E5B|nr:hypothetical protein [Nostoc cycadae]